jgi:tetratricopeptide (TPR) repeat protein
MGDSPGPEAAKANVFISYSRKDMSFTDRLAAALRDRQFEPLVDRTEIYAFEDWWSRIETLIAKADTVIFVLSPEAVASPVCVKEIAFAASLHKRFAPIVLRRVDDKQVPEALARLNFIFFDDNTAFDSALGKLTDALQTDFAWIRKHTEYGEAARRWASGSRAQARGLLLRPPVLEQAEHWIAARPQGAPAPTQEMQAFIAESRRANTRRRNTLSGSLAAGLVLALSLAALAYWQRGIAVTAQALAERNFNAAKVTVDAVVLDMAQGLKDVEGMRAETARRILGVAETAVSDLASQTDNNPAVQRSQSAMYTLFSDTYLRLGALDLAATYAQKGAETSYLLVASAPGAPERQLDLARSLDAVGNVRWARGDRASALVALRESLGIRRAVADKDASNATWQRDLLVSLGKVGDILRDGDDFAGALASYSEQLGVARRLVAGTPDNLVALHDLSTSLFNVGVVRLRQNDVDGALAMLNEAVEVARALVAKDPSNTESQRVLVIDVERVGIARESHNDLKGALAAYRESLDIMRALARKDPENKQWQVDLTQSLGIVGNALNGTGDRAGALALYREALAIGRAQVAKDQNNPVWPEVMALNLVRIGTTLEAEKDPAGALAAYREAVELYRKLASSVQDRARWQREASIYFNKIGDILIAQGDREAALSVYQDGLELARALVVKDAHYTPGPEAARDVIVSLLKVGNVKLQMGDRTGALVAYQEGLERARKVAERADDVQAQ